MANFQNNSNSVSNGKVFPDLHYSVFMKHKLKYVLNIFRYAPPLKNATK